MPLRAATATATYRPIIEWDPLAKMAAIMAMVAPATAVRNTLVDRGAPLARQLRKADRLTLTASISKAPFSRFVMRPRATTWTLGTTAATMASDAAVARPQRDCCEDLRQLRHPRIKPLDDFGGIRGAGRGERPLHRRSTTRTRQSAAAS